MDALKLKQLDKFLRSPVHDGYALAVRQAAEIRTLDGVDHAGLLDLEFDLWKARYDVLIRRAEGTERRRLVIERSSALRALGHAIDLARRGGSVADFQEWGNRVLAWRKSLSCRPAPRPRRM